MCAALPPSVALVSTGVRTRFLGSVMLGEFVTFLHRNARIVILATPALILAAGAVLEVRHFIH